MNKIFFTGMIFLVLLSSCEDFFQTYMQVPPPPYKKGIVVNLYVTDDDTVLYASVSQNVGSLEDIKNVRDLLLCDATVQILDEEGNVVVEMDTLEVDTTVYYDTIYIGNGNGEITDTVVYPRDVSGRMINYQAHLPSPFGGHGEKFTLKVIHPEYGTASASQTMPSKPVITQPVYKASAGHDDYGGNFSTLRFDIVDPGGEENFYQVRAWQTDNTGRQYFFGVDTDDPLFQPSYDYNALLVEDKTFDGDSYTVQLKFYNYVDDSRNDVKVFVEVQSVSKDFYLYARTLEKALEAEDIGFFVEPVQVYNNIENGYGIFAMKACTVALASKEE